MREHHLLVGVEHPGDLANEQRVAPVRTQTAARTAGSAHRPSTARNSTPDGRAESCCVRYAPTTTSRHSRTVDKALSSSDNVGVQPVYVVELLLHAVPRSVRDCRTEPLESHESRWTSLD
ncbi:hypothetical protein [Pseudonocardia sp. DLS-67]